MRIEKFLEVSPLFGLFHAHQEVVGDFQRRLATEGIHLLQALILTGLFFEDRPVRPTELSRTLRVSKSNVSHSLRPLEKKGWIRRDGLDADARAYVFSLTPEGRRRVPALIKLFDAFHDHLESALSPGLFNASLNELIRSHRLFRLRR